MLNPTAIENALVAWVRSVTGLPQTHVYLADQNAPAPASGLFITLKLGTLTKVGRDQYGPQNEAGLRTLYGTREVPLALNAYRAGALVQLEKLATSLDKDGVIETLRAAGIVAVSVGTIANLTLTLPGESTIRDRRLMEVFLRVSVQDTETVGIIQQVELETTTQQPPAPDAVETVVIGEEYSP